MHCSLNNTKNGQCKYNINVKAIPCVQENMKYFIASSNQPLTTRIARISISYRLSPPPIHTLVQFTTVVDLNDDMPPVFPLNVMPECHRYFLHVLCLAWCVSQNNILHSKHTNF